MTFSGRSYPKLKHDDAPLDDGSFKEVRMIAEIPIKLTEGRRLGLRFEWGEQDDEGFYRPTIYIRTGREDR